MSVRLPGDESLADRLAKRIEQMSPEVRASFFSAIAVIDDCPTIPEERTVILNHRFDVFVVNPGDNVPYVVLARDTATGELVIAEIADEKPTPKAAASHAGRAWGVVVHSIGVTP